MVKTKLYLPYPMSVRVVLVQISFSILQLMKNYLRSILQEHSVSILFVQRKRIAHDIDYIYKNNKNASTAAKASKIHYFIIYLPLIIIIVANLLKLSITKSQN